MRPGTSFEEMRAGVGPVLREWTDAIVPGEVEPLPHSTYSPVYAWMYAYEKRLRHRIQAVAGRPLGILERRLFGPDGLFSEALSNAFLHGNQRSAHRPIRIRCAVGTTAMAFSITDDGDGFDFEGVLLAARRGGTYFHMAGNGMRALQRSTWAMTAYADGGRTLNILTPWA